MTKKIVSWEIIDHGADHPDYFQGIGCSLTEFDACYTGAGFSSLKSALEDAAEQLAMDDAEIPAELENEIAAASDKDWVESTNAENRPAERWTVQHVGYCGMTLMTEDFESESEARQFITDRIGKLTDEGFQCFEDLNTARSFEIQEPENCAMVPDAAGHIYLRSNEQEIEKYNENCDTVYYAGIRVKFSE
jgi:hypothetical protein